VWEEYGSCNKLQGNAPIHSDLLGYEILGSAKAQSGGG